MSARFSLIIRNLTLEEVKELLKHVRSIEQKNPDRVIICWIEGLENKTEKEALEILLKIFPRRSKVLFGDY